MPTPLTDLADYGELGRSEYVAYVQQYCPQAVAVAPDRAAQPGIYVTTLPALFTEEEYWQRIRASLACIPEEQRRRSLLVLDYAHEGPTRRDGVRQELTSLIEKLSAGFEPRQVCLLQHNRSATQLPAWLPYRSLEVNIWLAGQGQPPSTLPPAGVPPFENPLPPDKRRERRFISLNYWPRYHRVWAVLYLLHHNLLPLGFVSFPGYKLAGNPTDYLQDALCHRRQFDPSDVLAAESQRLAKMCPLIVDRELRIKLHERQHMETVQAASAAARQSYFALVSETGFPGAADLELRITEKTLKPIYAGQPFLVLGMPGLLAYLREFGFRTFHPYIDESYDDEADVHSRFYGVMDEVHRLATMPERGWRKLWPALHGIAEYNRQHFHGEFRAVCRAHYIDALLPQLWAMREALG